MSMLRRTVALLLTLVLVLGLAPMGAAAEQAPQIQEEVPASAETEVTSEFELTQPEPVVEYIPTQVNPLYADIYTAEDLDLPEFPDRTGADAEIMASYNYVSQEDAALQIRTYMKQRKDVITVYVKGPLQASTKQTAHDLMDAAMAHTGNPKEGDYLLWQYGGWNARITTNTTSSGVNYIYEFTMGYYTTAAQEAELDTAIMYLLWDLNVNYKSDYEKVKAVYDYICENITYDHTNPDDYKLKHTAYAALIDKTAVCQGYALLFYRLMLELGVDNRLIAGIGNGGGHGWNIVEIDGLYYNLDSTWDAGMTGNYYYFLLNTWNFLDHSRYLEYETIAFHQAYPMAAENYTPGVKGTEDPYIWLGLCAEDILWVLYRNGTLEIEGTGAIPDYPAVASVEYMVPWYYWRDEITGVRVCEGITRIGNQNFSQFPSLTSVSLPESLKEIGEYAFYQDGSLTAVKLPENLESIEAGTFRQTALEKVNLPDSLKTIGLHAFGETKLREAVVPGGVSEVRCFYRCENLTSVVLSEGNKAIGDNAFAGCKSLEGITIPASIQSVGDLAFEDCSALSSIRFCGDAPTISNRAFFGVTATATYPGDNATWTDAVKQNYSGTITWVPIGGRGDLNGDQNVNDADVEYLLWYLLFPDMYPVGSDVDMNRDGKINDGDVEYLLWNLLFPDLYPLN